MTPKVKQELSTLHHYLIHSSLQTTPSRLVLVQRGVGDGVAMITTTKSPYNAKAETTTAALTSKYIDATYKNHSTSTRRKELEH